MEGRHTFSIIVMYILGSTIINLGNQSHHAWQALLVAYALFLPVYFIYFWILKKHPNMNVFEIIKYHFPKPIAFLLNMIIMLYCFYLLGKVIFNYQHFVISTSLTISSSWLILLSIGLIVFYLSEKGIKAFTRFTQVGFFILMLMVILTFLFSLNIMNLTNSLPIIPVHDDFWSGVRTYLNSPLAESFVLLNLITYSKKPKMVFIGSSFAVFILILSIVRSIGILGEELTLKVNYPLYSSIGTVNIGSFFTRVESLSIIAFFITSLIKMVACVLSITMAFKELLASSNVKSFLIPIIIIGLILGQILFENVTEMKALDISYISLFVTVLIPLSIILFRKKDKLKIIKNDLQ